METFKLQNRMHLHHVGLLTSYAFDSRIPFLMKLKHQRVWTGSDKANRFFIRFVDMEKANNQVDIALVIRKRDHGFFRDSITLINLHHDTDYRLRRKLKARIK